MSATDIAEAVGAALHANLMDYLADLPKRLAESDQSATDLSWIASAQLLRGLAPSQAEQLRQLLRMVAIDAVSSTLGVLDGCSAVENISDDFVLSYGGEIIGPYLLDAFLGADEKVPSGPPR